MDHFPTALHGVSVAVFVASLVYASVADLRHFEVPNWVSGAIVLSFATAALLQDDVTAVMRNNVLTGVGVLAVGFVLFAARVVGGADVKLLAATSLWLGWPTLLPYLFWMALTGGMVALALVLFRRSRLPRPMAGIDWLRNLHARRGDVPYAVAIAMPALLLAPRLSLVTDPTFS